jgi:putative ABC transport system permease protein
MEFKRRFNFPALVSMGMRYDGIAVVEHGSKKTNPNVEALAVDENYLTAQGYEISTGRFFHRTGSAAGTAGYHSRAGCGG